MGSIAKRTRPRKKKSQQSDRISDLPDSIICKILSLLPTKYAVATSVLSTRWNSLFPFFCVPPISLQFDDSTLYNHSGYERGNISSYEYGDYYSYIDQECAFNKFVSKWLKEPSLSATGVDTVDLFCEREYDYIEVMHWIYYALNLNVKHLALRFYLYDAMVLFTQLNGRTCLESLDICIKYDVKLDGNFSLPNLKRLSLGQLTFYGEAPSLSELIAGCPMLEDLDLYGCVFQCIDIVIRSPLLKYFRISGCKNDSRYRLDLDAPNLQEFMLLGCNAARNYSLSTFKSLRKACVDIELNPLAGPHILSETELEYNDYHDADGHNWYYDNGVAKIVTACSSTHGLYLDVSAMDALHHSSLQLPTFKNLSWLSIDYLECDGWAVLARLLHCAPNLKELTFEKEIREEGAFADFERLVPSPPICLELHFKEIEFCEFEGKEEEIKLLEYFLKNGKVLEKAILHAQTSMSSIIAKKLHSLPSHSKIVLNPDKKFPHE